MKSIKRISLGHGSGGKMTDDLLHKIILPTIFGSDSASIEEEDAAHLVLPSQKIAFSTDSYIVDPIIFPGGNIGDLAVNGSVNDILMAGAVPYALSLAFILEEGLLVDRFKVILRSIGEAAKNSDIKIVSGDTKVAEIGKIDKIFINTSAIGYMRSGKTQPGLNRIKEGDIVIVNGSIGNHGIAILAARNQLEFETKIRSDSASLKSLVDDIYNAGIDPHAMRDLTRGGLATVMVEMADGTNLSIELDEDKIPVDDDVYAASELLGLDVTHIANEGKMVVLVDPDSADRTLDIMRKNELGRDSSIIGKVTKRKNHPAVIKSVVGGARVLQKLQGEILPRIC